MAVLSQPPRERFADSLSDPEIESLILNHHAGGRCRDLTSKTELSAAGLQGPHGRRDPFRRALYGVRDHSYTAHDVAVGERRIHFDTRRCPIPVAVRRLNRRRSMYRKCIETFDTRPIPTETAQHITAAQRP